MLEVGFVALGALLAGFGIAIAVRSTTPNRRLSSAVVIVSGAAVGLVSATSATGRSYGVAAALVLTIAVVAEASAGLALVVMARASGAAALDPPSRNRGPRREQAVVRDRDELRDGRGDR